MNVREFNFFVIHCISACLCLELNLFTSLQKKSWNSPTAVDLISYNGYPIEVHEVETEDGYILEVHRIPYGKEGRGRVQRPPLLLQHGFLCSSACWVIPEPGKGLGYRLADAGYDVWIGNDRGNTYSKKHKTVRKESSEFWDFSFHELGFYDLPAVIDYMLNATGESQITYVGHSQGTTQFFVMASTRPEYNDKVRVMSALAPVAYVDGIRGFMRLLSKLSGILIKMAHFFGISHVLDHGFMEHIVARTFCSNSNIFQSICDDIFYIISGFDSPQFNKSLIAPISDHCPSGCSIKQLIHLSQLAKNGGKFTYFDYGKAENLKRYNSTEPPKYDIEKITCPAIFHYSQGDYLAPYADVERLSKVLPHAAKYKVALDEFNHIDYMWAIDVNKLVYDKLISVIKSFL